MQTDSTIDTQTATNSKRKARMKRALAVVTTAGLLVTGPAVAAVARTR
jgi:hypothetical protein